MIKHVITLSEAVKNAPGVPASPPSMKSKTSISTPTPGKAPRPGLVYIIKDVMRGGATFKQGFWVSSSQANTLQKQGKAQIVQTSGNNTKKQDKPKSKVKDKQTPDSKKSKELANAEYKFNSNTFSMSSFNELKSSNRM